jgi:large subunit ribosomal protein L24
MALHERAKRYTITIRKGDNVFILSGRDAGKSGRVLSINPRKNTLVVEHANIIKRHTRPNPNKNIKGGIVEKEGPIHVSNVQIVCASCGKHTRIGKKTLADGSRSRVCKRCGTTLDK